MQREEACVSSFNALSHDKEAKEATSTAFSIIHG
jgi:hypothetical protein